MEIKLLKRRKLKRRLFLPPIELPEVVTELPEKVEVELESVEFALPKSITFVFKPKKVQD